MKPWARILCLFGAILVLAYISASRFIASDTITTFFRAPAPDSALFVGDVMLARSVERLIEENGSGYIFSHVTSLQKSHRIVVGNFESAMPENHVATEDYTFQFSTATSSLSILKNAGFTHVTLANNHTYDFGESGYRFARTSLQDAGIIPFGNPLSNDTDESVTYITLGNKKIALVGIHAVWHEPDMAVLQKKIDEYSKVSDYQIAVIHWGTEYEAIHSESQERIAHELIDIGFDGIIGHHPHVVEDIGWYKNAPIFYSLGNYVFDQYWNDAVQTGLAVALTPNDAGLAYTITPIKILRSAPAPMPEEAATVYLEALAHTSAKELQTGIARGSFEVRD